MTSNNKQMSRLPNQTFGPVFQKFCCVSILILGLVSAAYSKDFLVPVAFPDYEVTTGSGGIELGHAGILFIRGSDGLTKYYEYGRYDPPTNLGIVKTRSIPNVTIEASGQPSNVSLKAVLRTISLNAGAKGRISASFIEVNGKYSAILTYVDNRLKQNTDPNRPKYAILTNNCMHFVKDALASTGISLPSMVDPRPNSYIEEIRDDFMNLDYDYALDKLTFAP
jgi:hypothetical protein